VSSIDAAHHIVEIVCTLPIERVLKKGIGGVKVEHLKRAMLRDDVPALQGPIVQHRQLQEGVSDGRGDVVLCL